MDSPQDLDPAHVADAPRQDGPNPRLGYALRGARIVHVSEVPGGLACACICAGCSQALIAKKGLQRRHHFAHVADSRCDGGTETLLHQLAKEIIFRAPKIRLPEYRFYRKLTPSLGSPITINRLVSPEKIARIDRCERERPIDRIVPDLLLESHGEQLIMEIAVFHGADREKLCTLTRLNLPALEIRLKPEDVQLDRTALARKLLETTEGKTWLFHPKQRAAESEWFGTLRQVLRDSREAAAAEYAQAAAYAAALADGLAREAISPPAAPNLPAVGSREWQEENVWAEQFNRRYGRYPSISEALARRIRR